MLRIKDEVDLKELERYGFEKRCFDEEYFLDFDYNYSNSVELYIPIASREICIQVDSNNEDCRFYPTNILCLLFDLIQAGMVEKIKGE